VRIRVLFLFALLAMAVATPAEGATWSTVPSPAPEGFAESSLAGVSCTSPTFCLAVGAADDGVYGHNAPGKLKAFSEVWDGTSWTPTLTADPPGAGGALASVSCVSPSFCVAVGATHSDGEFSLWSASSPDSRGLVEVWNGVSWSIEPTPAGAVPNSGLRGVTCLSTSFCLAVGSSSPRPYAAASPMVESWNGKAWKLRHTPFVAKHGSHLLNIACAARSSCLAVGYYDANHQDWGAVVNEALAEHWNGHRWTVGHPPAGHNYSPSLGGVACPSRTECIAVGSYLNGQNASPNSPLVERWVKGRWRWVTAGLPRYGQLSAISCIDANRCMAVGRLDDNLLLLHDNPSPMALTWNGSRWAREAVPTVPVPKTKDGPDTAAPMLLGVSCLLPGGCEATGVQGPSFGYSPLIQSAP
jgi:hypothetical protein